MHLLKPNYPALLKWGGFACGTIYNQICQKRTLATSDTFAPRNASLSHEQGDGGSPPGAQVCPVKPAAAEHPPICSMRFLQESAGMGWIICRASVSVVGLSASAGHSSGVAPFPGVEDDSLPERSRGRISYFKARPHLGRLGRGVRTRGPGQLDPPRTVQAAAPPGQLGPTGPFCHSTRARHGDSFPHQPALSCMFSELAGRHRKLGAPCALRGAARPPRRSRGQQPSPRRAPRPPPSPVPSPFRAPVLPSQGPSARRRGCRASRACLGRP